MSEEFSARAAFPPTRASVVAETGSEDAAVRARAFAIVAGAYWKPTYAHVRLRHRRSPTDAADLTQAFFARALDRRMFASYDASRGRFRTYLRSCLDHFVHEVARHAHREKRGGGQLDLSLDFDVAERELAAVDASDLEACFDAAWMRSLFATSVEKLGDLCRATGKEKQFAIFRRHAVDDDAERPSYAALAEEHGVSVTDVTNYLAWARRELRRLVLDTLREITTSEAEFREEARAVLGIDP